MSDKNRVITNGLFRKKMAELMGEDIVNAPQFNDFQALDVSTFTREVDKLIDNPPWGSSPSPTPTSNSFLTTITFDGEAFTADKTPAEIGAAYDDGKDLIFKLIATIMGLSLTFDQVISITVDGENVLTSLAAVTQYFDAETTAWITFALTYSTADGWSMEQVEPEDLVPHPNYFINATVGLNPDAGSKFIVNGVSKPDNEVTDGTTVTFSYFQNALRYQDETGKGIMYAKVFMGIRNPETGSYSVSLHGYMPLVSIEDVTGKITFSAIMFDPTGQVTVPICYSLVGTVGAGNNITWEFNEDFLAVSNS